MWYAFIIVFFQTIIIIIFLFLYFVIICNFVLFVTFRSNFIKMQSEILKENDMNKIILNLMETKKKEVLPSQKNNKKQNLNKNDIKRLNKSYQNIHILNNKKKHNNSFKSVTMHI